MDAQYLYAARANGVCFEMAVRNSASMYMFEFVIQPLALKLYKECTVSVVLRSEIRAILV